MARVLIPYGTTEGQTAKIADVIADVIRDMGHTADAVDINGASNTAPAGYDAVIIGASIHMGKHGKHVVDFVQKNHDTLEQIPSAFFSVSLAAHGDTGQAETYVDEFEEETGWRPDQVALFDGALLYTDYGFIKRHVMKKIAQDNQATSDSTCHGTTSTPSGTRSNASQSTSRTGSSPPRRDRTPSHGREEPVMLGRLTATQASHRAVFSNPQRREAYPQLITND